MSKICLVGASGKMGAMLTELDPELFACGVDQVEADRPYPIFKSFNDIPKDLVQELDGILDFSNVSTFNDSLDFALKNYLPIAVGTTGLTDEMIAKAEEASRIIPVLITSNMSIGINTIAAHVPGIVESLGSGFDIEIIEKHHNQKVDAPSGTALLIADAINKSQGNKYHYVIIAGNDEVIEIKHTAYSRKIFAEGALKAIKWLIHQKPDFYTYQDVIIK